MPDEVSPPICGGGGDKSYSRILRESDTRVVADDSQNFDKVSCAFCIDCGFNLTKITVTYNNNS